MDELMVQYYVRCLTEGCENYGHILQVPADPDNPSIQCGPCGHMITDIEKIK